MKQFMEPEIEIVKFSMLDVIASSVADDELGWAEYEE